MILILKWKLISIILPEDSIAIIRLSLGNTHGNDLILATNIGEKQCRPKNFATNELVHLYVTQGPEVQKVVDPASLARRNYLAKSLSGRKF